MATQTTTITKRAQTMTKTESGSEKATKQFEVDLTKPLVFQVGHLLDRYDDWVHKPVITKQGPRLFESDFMESLTNTKWWVIPLIWGPVVLYSAWKSLQLGVPVATLPGWMGVGALIWTFLEYSLHRFLFHWTTSGYWTNTLHYMIHGCHHKHPQDPYRLVFPPALCLIFISIIVPPFRLIFPPPLLYAGFAGGLLGYITYDVTHFWCHFGLQSKIGFVAAVRRYHLAHHFKNYNLGFGITSPLWDYVFGSHP